MVKAISATTSLACYVMGVVVQYHVVSAAAPQYFTLWAVSSSLFGLSLLVNLAAK